MSCMIRVLAAASALAIVLVAPSASLGVPSPAAAPEASPSAAAGSATVRSWDLMLTSALMAGPVDAVGGVPQRLRRVTSDGTDWQRLAPDDLPFIVHDFSPVTFASDGDRIVALGTAWDGHQGIWFSHDGRSWSEMTPSTGLPVVFASEAVAMAVGRHGLVGGPRR